MKADVILKLMNNEKYFATITKRFDIPDGLVSDIPPLTIKLTDGLSIQPELHIINYDMDSQIATLTAFKTVTVNSWGLKSNGTKTYAKSSREKTRSATKKSE